MAALLYLPRLMVYHAQAEAGSPQSDTFKVMERRLLRAIATPAMIAAWGLGVTLATITNAWSSPWLHAKLVGVAGLTAMHMAMARWVRTFASDANRRSPRFYRIANEVPTLLMVVVVILVIVKPI
ncbi:CopD family protein [Acuticoccus sp.]|uniref:CopD family protein n=1 Tax=Acuticoccus sp. TaxID=1904378 RepID=UPI003B52BFBD